MSDARKRNRIPVLHPSAAGFAVLTAPLPLLLVGWQKTEVPAIIIGAGLPALAVFSLFWLLICAPAIIRCARKHDSSLEALPIFFQMEEAKTIAADPQRPQFLPGVRLYFCWRFAFGPFRKKILIPLPSRGPGRGDLNFSRRGSWKAQSSLVALDPFGLFVLECPLKSRGLVYVPPQPAVWGSKLAISPSTAAVNVSPRLKEDTEDRQERRLYIPGDDPRRLDWRNFARTGELLLRVGQEGSYYSSRIWLTAFCRPGHFSRQRYHRLDTALSVLMAICRSAQDARQDVHLCLPGEAVWEKSTHEELLKRLASARPGSLVLPGDISRNECIHVVCSKQEEGFYEFQDMANGVGIKTIVINPEHKTDKPFVFWKWILVR